MQIPGKRWEQAVFLAVVVVTLGYLWLNGPVQTAQSISTAYVSASVPAPGPGQKKVVLMNLGMT